MVILKQLHTGATRQKYYQKGVAKYVVWQPSTTSVMSLCKKTASTNIILIMTIMGQPKILKIMISSVNS